MTKAEHRRSRASRRRWVVPATFVVFLAVLVTVVVASTSGGPPAHQTPQQQHQHHAPPHHATSKQRPASEAPAAPLTKMLGQMIVGSFTGTSPSASLLTRIRAGQLGGVILFADNVAAGLPEAQQAIGEMQRAAAQGGNPPLLVMTDQEGGEVSRLPGPPTLAASQMTSPALAFSQGQATGRLLRSVGVNLDLAPVADVERVPDSFLGTRSFGSSPSTVAADACAFARGLAAEHVAYTLKHFPGLGRATQSTDVAPVSIVADAAALRADYAAYRSCGHGPLALVMISNATYPTLTGPLPAVMSPLTYQRELPDATAGAPVVTISDDLEAGALVNEAAPARHAINAGLDLLLYAGTEQGSAAAYATLLDEARTGVVDKLRIQAAYDAIAGLKRRAHL